MSGGKLHSTLYGFMEHVLTTVNIITDDQVELTSDIYFYQKCQRLKTIVRKQAAVSKLPTG